MGGNLNSQRLGFISFYCFKNSELCEMDLATGERELCPLLSQFQWAGSQNWPVFSVLVLAGPFSSLCGWDLLPIPADPFFLTGQNHYHVITPTQSPARDRRRVTSQKRRNSSFPCGFSRVTGKQGNFIWALDRGCWVFFPLLSEFQFTFPRELPEHLSARWYCHSPPNQRSY